MQANQQQSVQIPEEIHVYLEDLLNSAGVVYSDAVMREAMIQELFIRLDKFLTLKLLDHMPTEKLEAFSKLTDTNPSDEAVQKFVQENLPNSQEIFTLAFGEFKDLYLSSLQTQQQNV